MIAVTAVSIVPWPLITITGNSFEPRRMWSSTCRPSSREPSSQMSSSTSVGGRDSISASAAVPSLAWRTL